MCGRGTCEHFDMPEVLAWGLSLMISAHWSKGFHLSNSFIHSMRTWKWKRWLNADWSRIKPKLICPSLLCVSEAGAQGSFSGLVVPGSFQPAISSSGWVLWWLRESFTCQSNYCSWVPLYETCSLSPTLIVPETVLWCIAMRSLWRQGAYYLSFKNSHREGRMRSSLRSFTLVLNGLPPVEIWTIKCETFIGIYSWF